MIYLVQNIPTRPPNCILPVIKTQGFARFVYISTIRPLKNLCFAVEALRGLPCELDIYGPIDDEAYWRECQGSFGELKACYRGPLSPDLVIPTLQQGHFLIFPTLNENFGYIVYESFCAACPVLMSNQTDIWHQLLKLGGGLDLPLDLAVWRAAAEHLIAMDSNEYQEMREGAILRAWRYFRQNDTTAAHKAMFEDAAKAR